MTEERITETTDTHGNTHTTRIITDGDTRGSDGGAAKWVFLLILAIAVAVGAYVMTQTNAAEIAKDNAVAGAAEDVGNAANQVGDAVQDAAGTVTEGE